MNQNQLTLLHFGDLHLWQFAIPPDLWPKRFLGLANLWLHRRRKFPPRLADALQTRLSVESADFLLFSGDLTTTSLPQEFAAGARFFEPLRNRWRDRLICIPGNHDRYTPLATRARSFEAALPYAPGHYPITFKLNDHWSLVAFDCSVPRLVTSRGRLDPDQLAALRSELQSLNRDQKHLVVMGHYPLLYPSHVRPSAEHMLQDSGEVLSLLREFGVKLYLHGHKHQRWRIDDQKAAHLNCGSAGMTGRSPERAAGYLKITLDAEKILDVTAIHLSGLPEDGNLWAQYPLNPTRSDTQ